MTRELGLTPRQLDVLHAIARLERGGDPVTGSRVADILGLARQNLRDHLLALRDRHLIRYEAVERQKATVALTDRARAALGLAGYPLVGEISAGQPVFADQQIERFVTKLDELLDLRPGDFLLHVRGDSMVGVGIFDGDTVIVRPTGFPPPNGEIVLALVPGENTATLKRFYLQGDDVQLVSENPRYAPMRYRADEVHVQGCLVGVIGAARPRRLLLP